MRRYISYLCFVFLPFIFLVSLFLLESLFFSDRVWFDVLNDIVLTEFPSLLSVILVNIILGIVNFPFVGLVFPKSKFKYAISSTLGLLIISYLFFSASFFDFLSLDTSGIFVVCIFWLCVNILIEFKFSVIQRYFSVYDFLKLNCIFMFFFFFWYWVRGHNAQLYGVERFMDFGILQSLANSRGIPIHDMWMSGKTINYYYFGQFVIYSLSLLTFVEVKKIFFLGLIWLFSNSVVISFSLGHEIYEEIFKEKRGRLFAGILSVFFTIFAGSLYMIKIIFDMIFNSYSIEREFSLYLPTRNIYGTITEMPMFGFLEADLHAHLINILFGLATFYVIVQIFKEKDKLIGVTYLGFYVLAFLLGILFMVNSWDAVTLGGLSLLVIVYKRRESLAGLYRNLMAGARRENRLIFEGLESIICISLLPLISYSIGLVWKLDFHLPVRGIGFVDNPSNLISWWGYWGAFVLFGILFFFKSIKFQKNIVKFEITQRIMFMFIVVLCCSIFWIAMELVYVRDYLDGNDWYRMNTVFKISNQLWMLLGIISGPMVVYLFVKNGWFSKLLLGILVLIVSTYPVFSIYTSRISDYPFGGVSNGLMWWSNKYPHDYEAFKYLEKVRDELPLGEKVLNIMEMDGDTGQDANMFSVFLGWAGVIGWHLHEWTWRGEYGEIAIRRDDVREFYTGEELDKKEFILRKYDISYVILGEIEEKRFGESLKKDEIESLGEVVFKNNGSSIIKI